MMAGYGGKRPGAGRRKGSRNRRTRETVAAVKQGLTPLEYLMSVYQDPAVEIEHRIEAAKAAAPYVHPRLSTVQVQATADLRLLTDEQLDAEVRELLRDPVIQGWFADKTADPAVLAGMRPAARLQVQDS